MPYLAELRVHPVKSFRPLLPSTARVEPWGLADDRRWMLVTGEGVGLTQRDEPLLGQFAAVPEPDGSLTVTAPEGKEIRRIARPEGQLDTEVQVFTSQPRFRVSAADAETNAWFSELLGREVRLVHQPVPEERPRPYTTSLADGYPLLLVSTGSLAALNDLIAADHPGDPVKGAPVPLGRFRPNLVIADAEPWEETAWVRFRVGAVEFLGVKQCGRCVVTTLDPETSERRGPEPLRALGRHRRFGKDLAFGMNVTPLGPFDRPLAVGDEVEVLEAAPLPEPDHV
ncbi:MOSC domain-containing protein [Streptacidiphilus monticola]|uniref:MOSC domain-containing protein n=1 Tax=Streptacidiphilus monticola TaxID=2161674 RepID=A0ABW1G6T3_9ACTN